MNASPANSIDAAASKLAGELRSILVTVKTGEGGGSGTAWAANGLIVTNAHVTPGEAAEVVLADGREFTARVTQRDADVDLALLQIDAIIANVALPGDSGALRVGELLFAIGNPWGLPGVLTRGVLSGRGPSSVENSVPLEDALRADLRLAPGNSGGPLADARGRVVGINSMIAGGMAIAVPVNTVQSFIAAGLLPRAFIGITGRAVPLPPAIAASFAQTDGYGLMVTNVEPGSPASSAGLIPGDVLLAFDGDAGGLPAIGRRLNRLRAGQPVQMKLLRGFEMRDVRVDPAIRA